MIWLIVDLVAFCSSTDQIDDNCCSLTFDYRVVCFVAAFVVVAAVDVAVVAVDFQLLFASETKTKKIVPKCDNLNLREVKKRTYGQFIYKRFGLENAQAFIFAHHAQILKPFQAGIVVCEVEALKFKQHLENHLRYFYFYERKKN